jgi:hypothetical protein
MPPFAYERPLLGRLPSAVFIVAMLGRARLTVSNDRSYQAVIQA